MQLAKAETIDEGAIKTLSAEIAATKADMMIANLQTRESVREILTDEQRAKADEMRQKWEKKRQQKRKDS